MAHQSVWIYVNAPSECVKVFASYDSALEWLINNDPEGAAVEYAVEPEPASAVRPRQSDVQIVLEAVLQARGILSEYLTPNMPQTAGTTVDELMDTLTNDRVLAAVSRIEGRKRFSLMDCELVAAHDDAS